MSKYSCETFEKLSEKVRVYISDSSDLELLEKAYNFAYNKHFGFKRLTGEDYITHPLSVAYILTGISADASTLAAALLHDVTTEAEVSEDELNENFGEDITSIVMGVNKINKLNFSGDSESVIQNQRKILVGLSEDVRVIIVKLADRLHNMKTLFALDEKKQKETAKETLDILAPIAHRLGINHIKTELEELSLRYLKPSEYYDIVEKLNATKTERDASVAKMIQNVSELLSKHDIRHEIKGRSKSIYSIYKKLDKGKRFSDIFDLLALRVFVNTEQECYQVLGIIHSKFKPVPNRFKDYVAMPKTNMYQSLHTTVFGTEGQLFEIQIRTYDMDRIAENGIASHWSYKEHGSTKAAIQSSMEQKLQFFKSIMELKTNEASAEEFVSAVKEDILKNTIYVFTPMGDVIELPNGATPLDFAFRVHTKVGERTTGALVNEAMVTLDYELQDNDVVKIITSNNATPNREWLNIVKTTQAKNKIKNYFNRETLDENIKKGEDLLNKELKKNKYTFSDFNEKLDKVLSVIKLGSLNEIYSNLGSGKIHIASVMDAAFKEEKAKEEKMLEKVQKLGNKVFDKDHVISVAGFDDIKVNFASCCNPVPGDRIVGYITKGNGITVHRMLCPNVSNLNERLIDVAWNENKEKFVTTILIQANGNNDVLVPIVSKASNKEIGIRNVVNRKDFGSQTLEMSIIVHDKDELVKFINDIRSLEGIIEVERLIK